MVKGLTNAVLKFVISEWDALRGARVLDYGCGIMPYSSAFALAAAELIGADIGPNKIAQIRISDEGSLPIVNDSFDYVMSFQVLEHVPIPHDYLTEAYRVLKPGGKLFLMTHGVWPYHPTPGDYHRWTKDGLIDQLGKAGFGVGHVDCILNEYSAALQLLVMSVDYRGAWRRCRKLAHLLTNLTIWLLENRRQHEPQIPAVLCVLGVKR